MPGAGRIAPHAYQHAPSAGFEEVLDLLGRAPKHGAGRIAPHAYLHTLTQESAPGDSELDYEVEWVHRRMSREDAPPSGQQPGCVLSVCPLSNILYDANQTMPIKLSTVVQYMRVIRRTHSASGRVNALMREAAELEQRPLPAFCGAVGQTDFVAASTRGLTEASNPRLNVERVVSMLIDGVSLAPLHWHFTYWLVS